MRLFSLGIKMELKKISVDDLRCHPKNPRIAMRQDVIDGIASQLLEAGEFSQKHAVHARPVGDGFELVSGHHRKAACEKAGLAEIWAWVEDMTDDEAFMALVLSNNQGELDPLEIGIHAFEAVPLSSRGRGSKGEGLKGYAEKIGKPQQNITRCRDAGEVVKFTQYCVNLELSQLLGRAFHLAAIHKLPQECWAAAVQWLVEKSPSVADVTTMAERVKACIEKKADWLPVDVLFARCTQTPDFNAATVAACASIVDATVAVVNDTLISASDRQSVIDELQQWLRDNSQDEALNRRKLQAKCDSVLASLQEAEESNQANWRLGDWRDHVDSIEDGSINLLLIDPPYGMAYQSNRKADKHQEIENDGNISDATGEIVQLLATIKSKMATDSHIICFCRWDSEAPFAAAMRASGLTVKGGCIWVKDNHGSGDLKGGFAPKHERMLHAVKGSPVLYQRHPDVFESPKVGTQKHPTEKPVALLRSLIECTTVEGHLVVDLFAGVASTCVAASECNRRWFGCEIKEEYHKIGMQRIGGGHE